MTQVPGIYGKMSKISEEMGFLSFDKKNTGQGYKYASASGVIRKLQNLLIKHKVMRYCEDRQVDFIPGESNKSNLCISRAYYRWVDLEDGSSIRTTGIGNGKDSGDKAGMKSATADNKYDIAHSLCLTWGAEDPEGSDPEAGDQKKKRPSLKSVLDSIESATTLKALEETKASILNLSASSKEKAKNAYKARKETL